MVSLVGNKDVSLHFFRETSYTLTVPTLYSYGDVGRRYKQDVIWILCGYNSSLLISKIDVTSQFRTLRLVYMVSVVLLIHVRSL